MTEVFVAIALAVWNSAFQEYDYIAPKIEAKQGDVLTITTRPAHKLGGPFEAYAVSTHKVYAGKVDLVDEDKIVLSQTVSMEITTCTSRIDWLPYIGRLFRTSSSGLIDDKPPAELTLPLEHIAEVHEGDVNWRVRHGICVDFNTGEVSTETVGVPLQ